MIKKISLPGYYAYFKYMIDFLDYYHKNREFFYPDRIIDSLYDAPVDLVWTGGRKILYNNNYNMQAVLDAYNNFPEIKLRHIFTNCLLDQKLVNDYKCNHFVQQYCRPQDEVIINHPLLIQHFQDNYPNIPIIYSTTLGITDIAQINKITERNIYVMNYNYNNNDTYIQQLQHPENIEILCGEPCKPNCPYRRQHYISTSKLILDIPYNENDIANCPFFTNGNSFSESLKLSTAISNRRIEDLSQINIQYFKLSGRSAPIPMWAEIIIYYLALPKYRDQVRQNLLNYWW